MAYYDNTLQLLDDMYNSSMTDLISYSGDTQENIKTINDNYYLRKSQLISERSLRQSDASVGLDSLNNEIYNDILAKISDTEIRNRVNKLYDATKKSLTNQINIKRTVEQMPFN